MRNKLARIVLVAVLVVSVYHLIRDLLQLFSLDSSITDIFHRQHQWCGRYCDSVTLPLDILGIVVPLVALAKQRIRAGLIAVAAILAVSLVFMLLP